MGQRTALPRAKSAATGSSFGRLAGTADDAFAGEFRLESFISGRFTQSARLRKAYPRKITFAFTIAMTYQGKSCLAIHAITTYPRIIIFAFDLFMSDAGNIYLALKLAEASAGVAKPSVKAAMLSVSRIGLAAVEAVVAAQIVCFFIQNSSFFIAYVFAIAGRISKVCDAGKSHSRHAPHSRRFGNAALGLPQNPRRGRIVPL
jgi:hypothetical protein